MPSTTAKQAHLMAAVAHGWHPTGMKGPPVSVAKEFHAADKKKGKFEHPRGHGGKMEKLRGSAKTSAEKKGHSFGNRKHGVY